MVIESHEISIAAVFENSDMAVEFIAGILDSIECTLTEKNQIITAVEELYGNIAKYAYTGTTGMVTIRCALKRTNRLVIIQFADTGKPFNPLQYAEPDIKTGIREREIGGLGIFIVKRSVDKILYHHAGGKNIVTIMKKIA